MKTLLKFSLGIYDPEIKVGMIIIIVKTIITIDINGILIIF